MSRLAGALVVALVSLGFALLVAAKPSGAQVGSQATPVPATSVPPPNPVATVGPPSLATGCGKSGPAISGGQTTGLGTGDVLLQVTLPAQGAYFTLPAGRVTDEPALMICNVDHDASVIISAVTGRELSRTAADAAGNAILDQIAASARLTASPRPTGGAVQPPSTGDGGLR